MACNKYQLINTGTTNAYITFRRCEDGAYERNYECIPFRIYNLWVMDDTLVSSEMSQLALESEGAFPPPAPEPGISMTFDVSSGDEYIYASSNDEITYTVSWGDGTVDVVTDTYLDLSHTYSSGIHTAKITFSDPTSVDDFEVYESNLTAISSISLLTNLEYLYLENNSKLTSYSPITLPQGLIDFSLYQSALTSFAPPSGIPDTVEYLDIDGNALSCAEVTNTLAYLETTNMTNPEIYLWGSAEGQTNCSCISEQAAIDSLDVLDGKGYVVYVLIC